LLLERLLLTNGGEDDALALWMWDIYWIGTNVPTDKRVTAWTEFGLYNIIKTGAYRLYNS